jgi:hypothetical protein
MSITYPGEIRKEFYRKFYGGKSKEDIEELSKTIETEYNKFKEYWTNLTPKDTFEQNMKVAVLSGEPNKSGLIVYAIYHWHAKSSPEYMEMEKKKVEERAAAEAAKASSQHVGNVGDKIVFDTEIIRIGSYSSDFGNGHYIIFKTSEGNTLVWYTTSNSFILELESLTKKTLNWPDLVGLKVQIKGTIKAHKEYRGEKNTVITRVKVLKLL